MNRKPKDLLKFVMIPVIVCSLCSVWSEGEAGSLEEKGPDRVAREDGRDPPGCDQGPLSWRDEGGRSGGGGGST